jgi:hypothetical protein
VEIREKNMKYVLAGGVCTLEFLAYIAFCVWMGWDQNLGGTIPVTILFATVAVTWGRLTGWPGDTEGEEDEAEL